MSILSTSDISTVHKSGIAEYTAGNRIPLLDHVHVALPSSTSSLTQYSTDPKTFMRQPQSSKDKTRGAVLVRSAPQVELTSMACLTKGRKEMEPL
jgi:hypothetical protein